MGYSLVNKQFANWKMAIEIVDLPINSMVIFHSYVTMVFGGVVATMEISQPIPGWWFGTCFIFHFICGMPSFPLTFICFKMVKTTNQYSNPKARCQKG